MASVESTSSSMSPERKPDAAINKMKGVVERLRLENATLKRTLDVERSGVRALKAQHEAMTRNIKTEHRKREEFLEYQLKSLTKAEKPYEESLGKKVDHSKLIAEVQSLKASNKSLQERLKVARDAESGRASELRAQVARHAALEHAAQKVAREQARKLLEEIKSKERIIIQLRREVARSATKCEQAQRMEGAAVDLSKKLHLDQGKEKTNREDLKTDIQHRKETFYRETPNNRESTVSSPAPSQPSGDMWCSQCRVSGERAAAAARECARLTDALRDARDQLELMEFRLLELEDASGEKGARDNLTDTDSGCVSPGSRIKDSASPELKRMDSGYKSPHIPSSPCNPRKDLALQDDFKEDFARAQVLADILDRTSESSDSLKSYPVKEHLEQMILNAGSAEDRSCLEQVLMLLYNFQAFSSSVSEDECYQVKPKRLYDHRTSKLESDLSNKTQKAIATVTPYSQQSQKGKCHSLESLCSEESKKPNSVLQESGIFEEVETEAKSTQTDVNEPFEFTGELNNEIQRLNSIREKLERQGVRNRTLGNKHQDDGDGLECRCVKLGKKHKQYYERRLKFLEGKISIYEAAQDIKESKLAQRLQKEFQLENRIQELESQYTELQDKYERLEEECCELEEIENDTRLHWQQLEMDYELCSAQLRDMKEQRECSRAQAERLVSELTKREITLKARESELLQRLDKLEKAVPALIAWNVVRAIGVDLPTESKRVLQCRMGPFDSDAKTIVAQLQYNSGTKCHALTNWSDASLAPKVKELQEKIAKLLQSKKRIEDDAEEIEMKLQAKIKELEDEIYSVKRQLANALASIEERKGKIDERIEGLEYVIAKEKEKEEQPANEELSREVQELMSREQELVSRVAELERREGAYLEMLTQADDMWAEMEGGYKKKIEEAMEIESQLKEHVNKLEIEKEHCRRYIEPMKIKLRDAQESESSLRIALDKSERDTHNLKALNREINLNLERSEAELRKSESALKELDNRFRKEIELLRKHNRALGDEVETQKKLAKSSELGFLSETESLRKELNRSSKSVCDLEVTNSELKEEVESLERQLALTQKALSQCKRKCEEKMKTLSHELSIKTEELEEMRSEAMRQTLHATRVDIKPDRTEYIDEGYTICTAIPKKVDYGRMHHSLSYITPETRCSCPSLRSQLVGNLIEDLFERMHNTVDDDLTRLCKEIVPLGRIEAVDTKAKITNYLLMAISKELVRSIGDADAKTDTDEWQRAVSSVSVAYTAAYAVAAEGNAGNAGVLSGASRLASVSCACAAARLCAALPELSAPVKLCQEEVLDHSDVKIMEEQLANAIESIVNCPSCALGTNSIVWSTDV